MIQSGLVKNRFIIGDGLSLLASFLGAGHRSAGGQ